MFSSNGVKSSAFMPRNGSTSVFRVGGLAEESIRELAVLALPQKPPHGRAEFAAAIPVALGLILDPDDRPRYHVNITGWPSDDHKDQQKLLALQLANASTLKLHT